jgi:hypothetical protein
MREPLDIRDDAALDGLLAEMREVTDGTAPFTVDVADRIMARVAFAGPIPRSEVGLGQLARWAAAAAAAGIALVSTFAAKAPSLPQIVEGVGRTTVEGTSFAVKTGGTMATVAAALANSAAVLYEAGKAAVTPLQGALGVVVMATVLIMLGVTTFVVGRDFRTTTR